MDRITSSIVIERLRKVVSSKVVSISPDPDKVNGLVVETIYGEVKATYREEDGNFVVLIGKRELVIDMTDVLGKPN